MNSITYIILVNWNGWTDTLECLESIFKLSNDKFRVIVCDNGSTDHSIEKIKDWAEGRLKASASSASMELYSQPAIHKPLAYTMLDKKQSENNTYQCETPLILIDCKNNLGFAGGNNVGLRYALQQGDMAWVWLLNNDTVIDTNALAELVKKGQSDPKIGIVGSTLIYYHKPDKVQAFGGARYFPCLGLSMHIGRFNNNRRPVNEKKVERQMDYVMGASMFVSRKFIETTGLMSEEYFLYYEELDWAIRGRGQFKQVYTQDSLIFHKAGASIGSSNKSSARSLFSDKYLMGNRLKITQKFYPSCIYFVRTFLLVEFFERLIKGKKKQALMILDLLSVKKF